MINNIIDRESYIKLYQERNKEQIKEYQKKYREMNKDYYKNYYLTHEGTKHKRRDKKEIIETEIKTNEQVVVDKQIVEDKKTNKKNKKIK